MFITTNTLNGCFPHINRYWHKQSPVAYPGFQREGCLRSGPIQKVCVGGGGGGASGPIYEKWGGGGGGGGGGDLWAHRKYLHVPT